MNIEQWTALVKGMYIDSPGQVFYMVSPSQKCLHAWTAFEYWTTLAEGGCMNSLWTLNNPSWGWLYEQLMNIEQPSWEWLYAQLLNTEQP